MKVTILLLLGLIYVSTSRTAVHDGPFWCLQSQREQSCTMVRDPVLAIDSEGNQKILSNECEACTDWSLNSFYKLRKCPKNLKKCTPVGSPICALVGTGLVDYSDECAACGGNQIVTQYFRGECPKKLDPNTFYCGAIPRPLRKCSPSHEDYVCGTDVNGAKVTEMNPCMICGNEDIISYVKGACEKDHILVDPIPIGKKQLIEQPVLAQNKIFLN